MTKEEILAKSRMENNGSDPYNEHLEKLASHLGSGIALLMCFVFFVFRIIAMNYWDYGLISIVLSANGFRFLAEALLKRSKKIMLRSMYYLIPGIIAAVLAFTRI